jgi:hypothetical protein
MRMLDKIEVSSIQGVAGGETLTVFLTACVRNARSHLWRAWPSASSSTGGGRVDHMGSVSGDCVGSVCGDRMGRFYGDRMGHFCVDRMGSVSGDRVGRASVATAGFCLRQPHGALDMLHRNEEHALISLHVD